jgi:hypothetical protein
MEVLTKFFPLSNSLNKLNRKFKEFAAKEKFEIVNGVAPPYFRIFAGEIPRHLWWQNALGLIQGCSTNWWDSIGKGVGETPSRGETSGKKRKFRGKKN